MKSGVTRIVFLIGGLAIKLPNPAHGQRFFIEGLLANVHESETWGFYRHENLAEVLFCAPFGLFQIARRCDPFARALTGEEIAAMRLIELDNKAENLGIRAGVIKVLDYGNISFSIGVGA